MIVGAPGFGRGTFGKKRKRHMISTTSHFGEKIVVCSEVRKERKCRRGGFIIAGLGTRRLATNVSFLFFTTK
jgi:hypothetical protein